MKGESKGQDVSVVYTVGHSTRTLEEFITLMMHYGIRTVADVRTLPGSGRVPQFNEENLRVTLPEAAIGYRHFRDLGGLRHTTRDSPNTSWRNKSFRGYADYMQTEAFLRGLGELTALARERTTAIMCAEAVPWRCHRSLIADALLVRGFQVMDIFSVKSLKPHKLTAFARVEGLVVTYPPAP